MVPGEQPQGTSTVVPTGVVRLLTATRIPSVYKKMVRVKVEGQIRELMLLFTPAAREDGLMLAHSAVNLSDGNCVLLVVQTPGTTPIKMKKGSILGQVCPVTECSSTEGQDGSAKSPPEVTVCNMAPGSEPPKDRGQLPLQQLNLKLTIYPLRSRNSSRT